MTDWDELAPRLARSTFRSRFRLTATDRNRCFELGATALAGQARAILKNRIGGAQPAHDGKQTPMRGHPVFTAQHATGCCCRGCLARWHGIPRGRELSDTELDNLTGIVLAWLKQQTEAGPAVPHTPDLWG